MHGIGLVIAVNILTPLGELFREWASFASGEVFETEVVVELQECLLVHDSALERLGGFLAAKETDTAAFQFLVDRGVTLLVVVVVGETVFVEGKGDEVVGR